MPLQMQEPNQVGLPLSGISEPVRLKRAGNLSKNASRFALPLQFRQGGARWFELGRPDGIGAGGGWGGWRAVIELGAVPSGFV